MASREFNISEACAIDGVPITTGRGWCKASGLKCEPNRPDRHPRWQEGVDRVRAGEHPDDVSADIGISTARLKEWCGEQGVTWTYRAYLHERPRHPKRDQSVEMMCAGQSCTEAAAFASVSKQTARIWFREDIGCALSEFRKKRKPDEPED